MDNKIPYVYFVKNKTTSLKYIGVRYAKNCNPKELWIDYFTSSNSVKKLINLYGKSDFIIKILHIFDNEEEAIIREYNYIKLAVNRIDYLNCYAYPAICPIIQAKNGKIGGNVQKKLGLGIHRQTKEERLLILENARQIQKENKKNNFINSDKFLQAARGKIGGPKNKGFVWLTDGNKNIKYTKKMQYFKSVEEFLAENKEYKKGRINGLMEKLRIYNTGRKRKNSK